MYINQLQPTLGLFRLNSSQADESFSVYDHPPVEIYQKRASLSDQHLSALFASAQETPPSPQRAAPKDKSLMLTEPMWTLPDLNGEAWGGVPGSSWLAFGLWLVALLALLGAGLPWTLLIFRPLADMGFGLARPLAMLAVAWLVWLGA